jgi:hypothetical protein
MCHALYSHCLKLDKALTKSTGSKLVEVYCDAKKGLSANSWPARYVSNEISTAFDPIV